MDQLEEGVTRIEAILTQLDKRLTEWVNHFSNEIGQLRSEMRSELRNKVDKWEVRIWFIIVVLLITLYQFLGR